MDIQVGDVWRHSTKGGARETVKAVGEILVITGYSNHSTGEYNEGTFRKDELLRYYTCIERDGKEYIPEHKDPELVYVLDSGNGEWYRSGAWYNEDVVGTTGLKVEVDGEECDILNLGSQQRGTKWIGLGHWNDGIKEVESHKDPEVVYCLDADGEWCENHEWKSEDVMKNLCNDEEDHVFYNGERYDVLLVSAYDDPKGYENPWVCLGHWNDGIKESVKKVEK